MTTKQQLDQKLRARAAREIPQPNAGTDLYERVEEWRQALEERFQELKRTYAGPPPPIKSVTALPTATFFPTTGDLWLSPVESRLIGSGFTEAEARKEAARIGCSEFTII